jgi:hypothetical protein
MSASPSPAPEISPSLREALHQLGDDLAWLEEHAAKNPVDGPDGCRLALAASLVRNCLVPFLNDVQRGPLHVAVVGGAGTGKSTLVNFILGQAVAETNAQAGYTRHPVGYLTQSPGIEPSATEWFGGRLRRLAATEPSNVDQDAYQIRPVTASVAGLDHAMVVWDCPDMTTWLARHYVRRLIEAIGLADIVVYVASDERYNDATPTQFLQLILQGGKSVVACLVKMQERQAATLVEHFRQEVIAKMPECTKVAACVAIPYLPSEVLDDPAGAGAAFRRPLSDALRWWFERPAETRQAVARGAVEYIERYQETMLAVAKADLQALQGWNQLVSRGMDQFTDRYFKEYLSAERFPRFDEALVRLLKLIELPGAGQFVSGALKVVRTPYRLVMWGWNKWRNPAPIAGMPETPVLRAALSACLEGLRYQAVSQAHSHHLWARVKTGFEGNLTAQVENELEAALRGYQVRLQTEVEGTARAIYEDLEKNPVALNTLRGVKFSLDAASIGGTLALGGLNWLDLVLVPLAASAAQALTERLGREYVDRQRESARTRQQQLFRDCVVQPLTEWLSRWPATGGSSLERLQLTVERVPHRIKQIGDAVRQRLEKATA